MAEEKCLNRFKKCRECCCHVARCDLTAADIPSVYISTVSERFLILHLCSLYPPPPPPELHSFLQTLLDLLQRAEDYIRDKVDLTFFTQTLPQLVEHIYNTAFTHTPRERRDLGGRLGLPQTPGTPLPPPVPRPSPFGPPS